MTMGFYNELRSVSFKLPRTDDLILVLNDVVLG